MRPTRMRRSWTHLVTNRIVTLSRSAASRLGLSDRGGLHGPFPTQCRQTCHAVCHPRRRLRLAPIRTTQRPRSQLDGRRCSSAAHRRPHPRPHRTVRRRANKSVRVDSRPMLRQPHAHRNRHRRRPARNISVRRPTRLGDHEAIGGGSLVTRRSVNMSPTGTHLAVWTWHPRSGEPPQMGPESSSVLTRFLTNRQCDQLVPPPRDASPCSTGEGFGPPAGPGVERLQ